MTTERALIDLFHEALDAEDVAGPFQRLQLELENPTGATRARRARRTFMTRNRLALLAAALVILVVASVLVGTRIYSSQLHNTSGIPAGDNRPQTYQAAVTQLLGRPLHFQALKPGDPCPYSSDSYGLLGQGPVYGDVIGVGSTTSWGTYWSVAVLTPPGLAGPVIVRSRDLTHGSPVLDIGPIGAGPIYGTDVYQGKTENQFQAVALDTDHVTKGDHALGGTNYKQWSWLQGFETGWGGGCVGAQIDGPGFSEIFYSDVPNN